MSNREKPTHLPESVDVVSLRILSDALRKELPKGFKWDYSWFHLPVDCGTVGCALGLAQDMGLIAEGLDQCGIVPPQFGLEETIHKALFYSNADNELKTYGDKRMEDVTPQEVADAIDYYLDNGHLP